MEVEGGYNQEEAAGFINVNAIRLKAHNILMKQKNPYTWREKLTRKKIKNTKWNSGKNPFVLMSK